MHRPVAQGHEDVNRRREPPENQVKKHSVPRAKGTSEVIFARRGMDAMQEPAAGRVAGATIQQKTVQEAGSEESLLNTIIVDKEANIKKQIFPNATKGLLAFATDTATLHFAPAGNFPANTQDLLTVDSKDFSAPDQILVV